MAREGIDPGAVHITIRDFLWSEETGLPADDYSDDVVEVISGNVFRHVFRAHQEVPSPYYERAEAACERQLRPRRTGGERRAGSPAGSA